MKNLIIGAFVGFALGNVTGFFAGVFSTKAGGELFEDMLTDEAPAALEKPMRIERPGFELSYPSNWKVDTKDEDYDPDQLFTIESPGSAIVMFIFFPSASDPAEAVESQVAAFKKLYTAPTESSFTKWGQYEGEGRVLAGRLIVGPATVRMFAHRAESGTFVIVEQAYDEDKKNVGPGFSLVESSFRLRAAPSPDE